jgi:hypothetical protein
MSLYACDLLICAGEAADAERNRKTAAGNSEKKRG